MEKIWLPPIEICCKNAELALLVNEDETVHIYMQCHEHKNHLIRSPFAKSRKDIKIKFSKTLRKLCGMKKPEVRASGNSAISLFDQGKPTA